MAFKKNFIRPMLLGRVERENINLLGQIRSTNIEESKVKWFVMDPWEYDLTSTEKQAS